MMSPYRHCEQSEAIQFFTRRSEGAEFSASPKLRVNISSLSSLPAKAGNPWESLARADEWIPRTSRGMTGLDDFEKGK